MQVRRSLILCISQLCVCVLCVFGQGTWLTYTSHGTTTKFKFNFKPVKRNESSLLLSPLQSFFFLSLSLPSVGPLKKKKKLGIVWIVVPPFEPCIDPLCFLSCFFNRMPDQEPQQRQIKGCKKNERGMAGNLLCKYLSVATVVWSAGKRKKEKKKGEGWQEPLVFALARLDNHACNQRTYPPYRPFPLQLLSSIIRIQHLSTIWPLGFPHRRAIDADPRGVRKVTIIAGFLAGVGLLGPLLPTEGPFTHALQSKWIGLWSDGKARNEPSEGRKTNNHPSQLPKPANPYESISNLQPDKGNKKTLASTANRAAYFFILFFILRWSTIKDKNNEKKKGRSWTNLGAGILSVCEIDAIFS